MQVWAVTSTRPTASAPAGGWVAKIVPVPPSDSAAAKKKKRRKTEAEKIADAVFWEYQLYSNHLRGHTAVPQVPPAGAYGEASGFRYLVMERLGQNLLEAFEGNGNHFPLCTVADFGKQILECLRQVHEAGFLYLDVKPQNFMLGSQGSGLEDKVYVVDFGVADKFISAKGEHREPG